MIAIVNSLYTWQAFGAREVLLGFYKHYQFK